VNDYIECGLQYRFSRIDKLEPEFRADAMVFGSTIHKTIADFHQARMIGNFLSVPELQSIFEDHWRHAAHGKTDIRYTKGKDFRALLDDGKDLVRVYRENVSTDGLEVLAIEEPFSFIVEGLAVPVIGVFDLVEIDESGLIVVSDLKTSGHTYSADEVDRNFQMTVYQMATKANGYRNRELLLRLDCLVKIKQPRLEQHYTTRSEIEERRAVRKMQQVWDGITKGVFVPNDLSWRCGGCGFKKHCDRWLQS